jgi:hypothetical protein
LVPIRHQFLEGEKFASLQLFALLLFVGLAVGIVKAAPKSVCSYIQLRNGV